MRSLRIDRRRLLVSVGVIVFVGILLCVRGEGEGEQAVPAENPTPSLTPSISGSPHSVDESIADNSPTRRISADPVVAGISVGMTSANTYAFLVATRASRGPGALAVATSVQAACRAGMGALGAYRANRYPDVVRANLSRSTASVEQGEALRVEYAQLIEARCKEASQAVDLEKPLNGDKYGERIYEARNNQYSRQYPLEAFVAMAEQGQLAAVYEGLSLWPYFDGVSYRTDSEDYRIFVQAMSVAAFRATSDPTAANPDLRLMTACLDDGICDGKIESVNFRQWPEGSEQRNKALALAERMTRAFRENDLSSFLPRKKGRNGS